MWHRTPIPDLLIAETALHHGLGVVHVDRDYDRIAEVRPLTRPTPSLTARIGALAPYHDARMTAVALDRPRAVAERAPLVEGLFFATVFTVTFAKLQWEVAGTMSFSDVVTFVFLIAFAVYRIERFDGRFPRAAAVTLAFFAAFLLVYLIGWFNLETAQSLAQWAKGMIKFLLHFLFLIAGVALIARRGMRFYWLTLAAFVGGLAANGAYGLLQLAVAETTGANLDEAWLQPITGGDSKINIFGAIEGSFVYRVNSLTGDPNHLGIEVAAGILLLLPIYLRLERGHRLRVPLALLLLFLVVVDLATLSRSGLLGLGCGFLVLAMPYRRVLLKPQFLVPLGVLARRARGVRRAAGAVLLGGAELAALDRGPRRGHALHRLLVHPRRARAEPALRPRAQHLLRLLRVPDREDELRAALVLRRLVRRVRPRRDARSSPRSSSTSSAAPA